MLKNKRILVTGVTGFIVANIVRYFLKEGANISILTFEISNKWRIKNLIKIHTKSNTS